MSGLAKTPAFIYLALGNQVAFGKCAEGDEMEMR
jgi:hypothetical protein